MDDLIISIVGLTVPFIFVMVILWIIINEKEKRRQLQADLYAKALEKGHPIPADLFAEEKKQHNPLNTGIILIAAGIGIMVFLWLLFSAIAQIEPESAPLSWIASAGFIPFMIGIAFLVIHFIEKKKAANKDA